MEKFKDFQPTAIDLKGLGSKGQEDWLVLPTSRTHDTGPIEESNFAAALERLGGESDTVQVHSFNHWGPGWFEIIVVHPSRESEAEEIEKSLENYPVLDEEDLFRREMEAAGEDWENWGEQEFRDIIKGLVELNEEQEDMLDSYVDLAGLWREVTNHIGWAEQNDGHSTNFNFKDAKKYLSEHPDLIWDAIDEASTSKEYLASLKKSEDEKLAHWHKSTRGYNPPTAYIDFSGGRFRAYELNSETVSGKFVFARTANLNDIIHRIRDGGYSRVVVAEGATDFTVDAQGWYPGSYSSMLRYLHNSLPRIDVRPSLRGSPSNNPPNEISQAYSVFGYGRPGRIHAGMTVTVAGSGKRGRVVMPSSEPGFWVLNMGGRHGTPAVVHEDNIITRGD